MLTKSLAYEWAQYNIRVNTIAPGFMKTGLTRPFFWRQSCYDGQLDGANSAASPSIWHQKHLRLPLAECTLSMGGIPFRNLLKYLRRLRQKLGVAEFSSKTNNACICTSFCENTGSFFTKPAKWEWTSRNKSKTDR